MDQTQREENLSLVYHLFPSQSPLPTFKKKKKVHILSSCVYHKLLFSQPFVCSLSPLFNNKCTSSHMLGIHIWETAHKSHHFSSSYIVMWINIYETSLCCGSLLQWITKQIFNMLKYLQDWGLINLWTWFRLQGDCTPRAQPTCAFQQPGSGTVCRICLSFYTISI